MPTTAAEWGGFELGDSSESTDVDNRRLHAAVVAAWLACATCAVLVGQGAALAAAVPLLVTASVAARRTGMPGDWWLLVFGWAAWLALFALTIPPGDFLVRGFTVWGMWLVAAILCIGFAAGLSLKRGMFARAELRSGRAAGRADVALAAAPVRGWVIFTEVALVSAWLAVLVSWLLWDMWVVIVLAPILLVLLHFAARGSHGRFVLVLVVGWSLWVMLVLAELQREFRYLGYVAVQAPGTIVVPLLVTTGAGMFIYARWMHQSRVEPPTAGDGGYPQRESS